MKNFKTNFITVFLSFIVCLLFLGFSCNPPEKPAVRMITIQQNQTLKLDTNLTDVPPGVPVKADANGVTLHLPPPGPPPPLYVGFVLYNTKAAFPLNLWVDNSNKGVLNGKTYWAEVLNFYPALTSRFVYITAMDPPGSDPYSTSDHAEGNLNYATIFATAPINGSSPTGGPSSYSYPAFNPGTNGKFYIINIVPNTFGVPAIITGIAMRTTSDGTFPDNPSINVPILNQGNIVIFVKSGETVNLTLNNTSNQGVNTTVYVMEPNTIP